MSTTLSIVINESKGLLTFSRVVVLGSEYTLSWSGNGTTTPTLVLTNPATDEILAISAAGAIKLNTPALINLFSDTYKRPRTIWAYAYDEHVVMGRGHVILEYSPLSFESGDDPELVTGLSERIAEHMADVANPHHVTLAQVGAAAASHIHDVADLKFQMPDGKYYKFVFLYAGGLPTFAFEETTAP